MSIKLKKQFEEFHDIIKLNQCNELVEKRNTLEKNFKEQFPKILEEKGIEDIKIEKFIDQGSYKINTTIKPKDNVYDRDVAVILELDPKKYEDPVEIKKMASEALEIKSRRVPKIKEPCITIEYKQNGEEKYHIDLPIYAKDELGNLYLARGRINSNKENKKWEDADPEGLNDYFLNKLSGDDGNQLRRIIRYLKKWKSEKYVNCDNDNEIPPSIGLTILSCEHFIVKKEGEVYDDLEALYHVVKSIVDCFSLRYDFDNNIEWANIDCYLPTKPWTDVFSKMKKTTNNKHIITFYKKLKKLKIALENAIDSEFEHEAAEYIQKQLGEEFEIPPKEETSQKTSYNSIKEEDSFAK